MDKHIYLTFLSDVKVNNGKVSAAEFKNIGRDTRVEMTNESAVRYLINKGYENRKIKLDRIFVFASNKIRQNIKNRIEHEDKSYSFEEYFDSEGKNWTHLDYFKKRIRMIEGLEADGDIVKPVDYDESLPLQLHEDNGMDLAPASSQGAILRMADEILSYYRNNGTDANGNENRIILHADLTGGLRNANMMMLAVMRILQYSGIVTGRIMYADYSRKMVDESDEIYRMFDLVAGADEFAQFGSVSAILRYYHCDMDSKPEGMSDELYELLNAMHSFADEVKVCRYGAFRKAIGNLREALSRFNSKSVLEMDFQERLMKTLQGRIGSDYMELISGELDDIKLIQWCVVHDYMQQALTLFTERVPEIVFKAGLLEMKKEFYEGQKQELKKSKDNRSVNFYVFSVLESETSLNDIKQKMEKKYNSLIMDNAAQIIRGKRDGTSVREWVQQLPDHHMRLADYGLYEKTMKLLEEIRENPAILMEKNNDDIKFLEEKHRNWYIGRRRKEGDKREEIAIWQEDYVQAPAHSRRKSVGMFFDNLQANRVKDFFSELKYEDGYQESYALLELIEKGDIISHITEEKLKRLKLSYKKIKEERNTSNHARLNAALGQKPEITRWINEALDALKNEG